MVIDPAFKRPVKASKGAAPFGPCPSSAREFDRK